MRKWANNKTGTAPCGRSCVAPITCWPPK